MSEKNETRRSGESAESMLREVLHAWAQVEIEIQRSKPGDSTAPFMRAYDQFERCIRRVGRAMPVTLPVPRDAAPIPTAPGHWLGCSLDPDHEGDCTVPRARR